MDFSKYLIVAIFILVFFGALSLCVWQIDRGYAKKELENAFSERQSFPVETNPGELNQNLYYRNIQISGVFGKKTFFVDNKTFNGKAGYVVFNPFTLATKEKILEIFKHMGATKVDRYELPNLRALNFVIHSALGGGVNSSLRLDRHGKTLSSHLLHELILPISKDLLPMNSPYLKKFKD